MTKKELYLKALRNQTKVSDGLVWVANFDWWYDVHKRNGTLPEEYEHSTNHDISRDIDSTIWRRVNPLNIIYDGVEVDVAETENTVRCVYKTPVGELEEYYEQAPDISKTLFLKKHLIREKDDIAIAKYIAEATHFELDLEDYYRQLESVGEDGIVLTQRAYCVPFIQFGKLDVGWEQGLYMWMDYKNEVDDLLEAYTRRAVRQFTVLAESPVEVISTGDNMDQQMFPPNLFEEYAVPYYQRVAEILHKKNKILQVHWCGQTQNLLHYLPQTGVDVVEAVCVEPMAPLTIREALDKLEGKVVIQGGIPAVIVCPEGGTAADFEKYMDDLLSQIKGPDSFILGMSDNIPVSADFERVKRISAFVKKHNQTTNKKSVYECG
jgi:Uroporphyrinogen decarboxylase (URO-D)